MKNSSDVLSENFSFKDRSAAISETLTELRHDFHSHPELSFQEYRTGEKIAKFLTELNLDVTPNVGKTGLTALLRGDQNGPLIAVRADIDALPVQELADVPFKSQTDGLMHACGHDIHITCALGAAMLLSEIRRQLPGSVLFIFQPAEELNQGAKDMVAEGVMTSPKVDMIFGLHNHPEVPVGKVAVKSGPLMSAVDAITLRITGKGGHGGLPHRDIDPVIATASTLMNIQTIVSRNVHPLSPAVVSFGTINGGAANNVIPDFVEATGTVRSYDAETQDLIEKRLKEIVESSAAALGCHGELNYIRQLPAVVNDPRATETARRAVSAIGGSESIYDPLPSTGGEDFSIFTQKAPGCFLWLGVGNPDIGAIHPWHSPLFLADERALSIGAGVLAQCAFEALRDMSSNNTD